MPIEKVDTLMKGRPKSKHDDVWTTTELTQILGFSRQYVWELIGRGKIASMPREAEHFPYTFSKKYIEKNFQKVARNNGTTSVEEYYYQIAFCTVCNDKFKSQGSKILDREEGGYYGMDKLGNRYCKYCTDELEKKRRINNE